MPRTVLVLVASRSPPRITIDINVYAVNPSGVRIPSFRSGLSDRQGGEQKENAILLFVGAANCIVEFTDTEGISHKTEVFADSLREAALLGVAQFRKSPFQPPIGPATEITVRVTPPPTVHTIRFEKLEAWLSGSGRTPAEQAVKSKLKQLFQQI